MAKATLQNLKPEIIKNLRESRDAKNNFHEGVGVGSLQEIEALPYEIDRIVWALNLLDDLRIDQGMMHPHHNHAAVYMRISLIYFWLENCVNSLKKIISDSQ